ncbi:hypothetical protein WJX77_002371 [Trebouxia sp. C0004]
MTLGDEIQDPAPKRRKAGRKGKAAQQEEDAGGAVVSRGASPSGTGDVAPGPAAELPDSEPAELRRTGAAEADISITSHFDDISRTGEGKVVLASLVSVHQKQAQHLRRRIATLLRGEAEVRGEAGEEEEGGAVPNRHSLCWKSLAQALLEPPIPVVYMTP